MVFTSKVCKNYLWKSDILSVTLPQVFFKLFASKNRLPGFSITETLAGNGLIRKGKLDRIQQNY